MVILDCLGMDTVSSIWLNGRLIGGTDNMFVRYSFDVAEFLFPGSNQIEIQFQSPLEYSQKMFDLQAERWAKKKKRRRKICLLMLLLMLS